MSPHKTLSVFPGVGFDFRFQEIFLLDVTDNGVPSSFLHLHHHSSRDPLGGPLDVDSGVFRFWGFGNLNHQSNKSEQMEANQGNLCSGTSLAMGSWIALKQGHVGTLTDMCRMSLTMKRAASTSERNNKQKNKIQKHALQKAAINLTSLSASGVIESPVRPRTTPCRLFVSGHKTSSRGGGNVLRAHLSRIRS